MKDTKKKTLIIYNDIEKSQIKFFTTLEEVKKYSAIILNANQSPYEKECIDFLFDRESGIPRHDMVTSYDMLLSKDWDDVIIITWLIY